MKRANSNESDFDFIKRIINYFQCWLIFIWERFNPATHFAMIILFCAGTATLAQVEDTNRIVYACILATVFFFRLRLFDEIKDYESDIIVNPKRPLPRGLLGVFDIKVVLVLSIIVEALIVHFLLPQALRCWLIALIWSLFMYKEFFIPNLIRPYLTTYATSHTLVTLPLTLALISGMTNQAQIQQSDTWSALGAWLVFNIFELGRKTYQKSEERKNVESYSLIWGRYGAVALVLIHAVIAAYAFSMAIGQDFTQIGSLMSACVVFLVFISGLYLFIQKKWTGSLYRAASSVFILLIYGVLALLPYTR
tara:strand:+ start:16128 stop:17051 length:924 start_codon:yes stop_codon:yes gene_type:complete